MYVRKFEADSLDDALGEIKRELGPDAIILKTVSNKGLKGAFKKKKIEITAAISEKNYTDKIKVDHVLDADQKKQFYKNSATVISKDISNHSVNSTAKVSSYGNMGLNRNVNTAKDQTKGQQNTSKKQTEAGLDSFLQEDLSAKNSEMDQFLREDMPLVEVSTPDLPKSHVEDLQRPVDNTNSLMQRKIDDLEVKLFELTKNIEKFERKEAAGLFQLRTTLKSLDINDLFIQRITKKACFELSAEDLENADLVYEFALREMVAALNVDMPLFSKINLDTNSTITILLSDTSCGQTSMAMKLAALKPDSIVVKRTLKDQEGRFTQKMFDINIVSVETIAQVVSEIRKATEENKTIFVDFQTINREVNETKTFIEGINRSFDNVEVLTCLSTIHSELYNKKILNQYKTLSNGIVLSQLDLCLNFGAIFNLHEYTEHMPFKFYGTGELIPDDIEGASAERILSGIFQF